MSQWKRVVFASEVDDDGNCPVCGEDYVDCPCPGPTQDDLYEYREKNGELQARPLPEGAT
jgi:hypothetical protein